MHPVLIKTCGIKTPEMARFCAEQGAHYIGIIFCESSSRYVDKTMGKAIANAAKEAGAIPVGVFSASNAAEIMSICAYADIQHIQLHGEIARQSLFELPESHHIIYATPIHPEHIPFLRPDADYLLFDAEIGGSGKTIDWKNVKPLPGLRAGVRFFLAGGLNPTNVAEAIQITRPFAVDVSSGIESAPGVKCQAKITAFIQHVNEVQHV